MNMNTLMVGYSQAYLEALTPLVPPGTVSVLEESDIIRKRDLYRAARRLGCVADLYPAGYQQSTELLAHSRELTKIAHFDAVVPGHEYAVQGAAAVAVDLGLRGAGIRAAAVLRDKLVLREVTAAAGILNPPWREIRGYLDILEFANGRSAVVKPANRQASIGVQLIEMVTPASAEQAWHFTTAASEYQHVPDRELYWRYLVEERLEGPEYSVEALVHEGVMIFSNITEKSVLPGARPIELGHTVPAAIPAATAAALRNSTSAVIRATEFSTGVIHAEWIVTPAGPALVECAGRCPGDHITDLIDMAWGTHFRLAAVRLLAGECVSLPAQPSGGAAIHFLRAPAGEVGHVGGATDASRMPGVQAVELTLSAGSNVENWRSSWDRPGYVIAVGSDGTQAKRRAVAAAAAVFITTR